MNEFNEVEFFEVCNKFGVEPSIKEVTINYTTSDYFNQIKTAVATDRRGEVVFCVLRPNGKVIAITCEEYPKGVFRIPTGGIGHSEDIVEAALREAKEELGLDAVIKRFIGVLKIKFEYKNDSVMFYSYMFILKETGGRLLLDASDDEISEVREVNIEGLSEVLSTLKDLPGKWNDWGRFRYETTNAIFKFLTSNKVID
ncbi:MAG: NUDIX hydrolase [Clostridia bacterium]|nr:NUDIX hydrolase [Clostridia bacterium]